MRKKKRKEKYKQKYFALKADRSRGEVVEKDEGGEGKSRMMGEEKRIAVWHRFMSQAGTNNDFEIYKHGRFAFHFANIYIIYI